MKNILVTVGIVVALVLGVVGLTKAPTVVEKIQQVGAVASPDVPSPYLTWGNLVTYNAQTALRTATTTPCSIQSPSSTSTLRLATLQITTGTTTATTWTVATSSTAFATTTTLNRFALASGAQGSYIQLATTSEKAIMAPNTYVVWGVEGTVIAGTAKLLGTCSAQFTVF